MSISLRPIPTCPLPAPDSRSPVGIFSGSGRVVRSLLAAACLSGRRSQFGVHVRSDHAEFRLRTVTNDLPGLRLNIFHDGDAFFDAHPVIVLCAGISTETGPSGSNKEGLFTSNRQLLAPHMRRLRGKVAVVVSNPTTELVSYLASNDISALGVGLENDNLRFKDRAEKALHLVGGHNFGDLVVGSLHEDQRTDVSFTLDEYRHISASQDKFRRFLAAAEGASSAARALIHFNDNLPNPYRWWAYQRLNSKLFDSCYSCGTAILNVLELLGLTRDRRVNLCHPELPLRLSGMSDSFVAGWPIDSGSREIAPLYFSDAHFTKLAAVIDKYKMQALPMSA
jgi:hypothetical protein